MRRATKSVIAKVELACEEARVDEVTVTLSAGVAEEPADAADVTIVRLGGRTGSSVAVAFGCCGESKASSGIYET